MNCKICGLKIETKDDIRWLEDAMVCTECYDHELQENIGDTE
jgi:hypothetical protein